MLFQQLYRQKRIFITIASLIIGLSLFSQIPAPNDVFFWYPGYGEVIDLIDLDYFTDKVNETVHFLIKHFSEY
ncbi:hypothetical protein H8E77_05170 [bacterium]|nr:hypothetical protein [bacterium]